MKNHMVVIFSIIVVGMVNLLPVFMPGMERVILAGSVGLMLVVGAYTGMDLSAIAEGSRKLPKGDFLPADKNKYLFMIIALLIITLECLFISIFQGIDLADTIAAYLFGALGVTAVYVAGMKNIKKASMEGKDKEAPNESIGS